MTAAYLEDVGHAASVLDVGVTAPRIGWNPLRIELVVERAPD